MCGLARELSLHKSQSETCIYLNKRVARLPDGNPGKFEEVMMLRTAAHDPARIHPRKHNTHTFPVDEIRNKLGKMLVSEEVVQRASNTTSLSHEQSGNNTWAGPPVVKAQIGHESKKRGTITLSHHDTEHDSAWAQTASNHNLKSSVVVRPSRRVTNAALAKSPSGRCSQNEGPICTHLKFKPNGTKFLGCKLAQMIVR